MIIQTYNNGVYVYIYMLMIFRNLLTTLTVYYTVIYVLT
jgi:hypothetical protein